MNSTRGLASQANETLKHRATVYHMRAKRRRLGPRGRCPRASSDIWGAAARVHGKLTKTSARCFVGVSRGARVELSTCTRWNAAQAGIELRFNQEDESVGKLPREGLSQSTNTRGTSEISISVVPQVVTSDVIPNDLGGSYRELADSFDGNSP